MKLCGPEDHDRKYNVLAKLKQLYIHLQGMDRNNILQDVPSTIDMLGID
jgi:hypothetical protein